jgi:hypothetical protein
LQNNSHNLPERAKGAVILNAVEYAKSNLQEALGLLNTCAAGMDDAQYNWKPGGTCNVAGKSHVHALTSIDFFINGIVAGRDLSWPKVAQEHGLPANPLQVWQHEGNIPVSVINEYSKTVQQAALDYVGTLSDADLDREIETQFFGKKTVAWLLQLAGNHAVGHAGDIAAVKGMQGLKGLPF